MGRAAVAFTIVMNADCSPEIGEAFWTALADKKTVGQALTLARVAYNSKNDAGKSGIPDLDAEDCVLVGDAKTRLSGVYTGTDSQSTNVWWVEL